MTYNIWAIQAIQNQLTNAGTAQGNAQQQQSGFIDALRSTMVQSLQPAQVPQPAAPAVPPAALVLPRICEWNEVDPKSLTSKKQTRKYIA